MTNETAIEFTSAGFYCPAGDFHIDPWRPVRRALVTHAHADHARAGMGQYLCTPMTAPVLRHRLGDVAIQTCAYGESLTIGGARVSFHPAGHVPGSAQVRVETGGPVWVLSGDYKTEADGLSTPFAPVSCDVFVSECTFGLPVFGWAPQADIARQINDWWADCKAEGRTAMLGAYSLGKAQRLLSLLDPSIGPILTHGAVESTNRVLRDAGLAVPETRQITPETKGKDHPGALVMAPPGALDSAWAKRFGPASIGHASGWMALRGIRRRRAADRGFVLSDHADWAGLNAAIAATGAETVYVTHGYTTVFRQWLDSRGYDARCVETEFGDDASEPEEGARPADMNP